MKLGRNVSTVTQGAWGVSFETSTAYQGAYLKVYKHHNRKGGLRYDANGKPIPFSGMMFQHGDAHNKWFPNLDAARQYALEHGYLTPYHTTPELRARKVAEGRRPWHFPRS